MAADDDLRINTLHRFAKHSPKLVLHEYSHCEVPAGCGGVVLRWIHPDQGTPATFRISHATGRMWLDGSELTSSLALLTPGAHTLALHLERPAEDPRTFTIGVTYDAAPQIELIRGGAPRWRCLATAPREGWTDPAFDDAAWGAIPAASGELIAAQDSWVRRDLERRVGSGEAVFRIDGAALWIRVTFTAAAIEVPA